MKKTLTILILTILTIGFTGYVNTLLPSPDPDPMFLTNFNITTKVGEETVATWDKIPEATIYEFGYLKDGDFNTPDSEMKFVETIETFVSAGVLESGTYVGKIIAYNEANETSVSLKAMFTVEDINNFLPLQPSFSNIIGGTEELTFSYNYKYAGEIEKIEIQGSFSSNFDTIEFIEESINKSGTITKTNLTAWGIYYLRGKVLNSYGYGEWETITTDIKILGTTSGDTWITDNDSNNVDGYTRTTLVNLENNFSGANWDWIKIWDDYKKTTLLKYFDYNTNEAFNLNVGDGVKTVYVEYGLDNRISVTDTASIILDTNAQPDGGCIISGIIYHTNGPITIYPYTENDAYKVKLSVRTTYTNSDGWVFFANETSGWVDPYITTTFSTEWIISGGMNPHNIQYMDKAGNIRIYYF